MLSLRNIKFQQIDKYFILYSNYEIYENLIIDFLTHFKNEYKNDI